MKKIWCLLLAAAMVTGAAQASHAVDFKAKGVWLASFQYGQNGNFTNGGHTGYDPSEDEFEARSRVRLVIDAVADENLSGQVYFEIGKSIWGKAEDPQGGMAMGADKNIVKLKRAFIDWRVPDTDLKLRMGIQGIGLPYMAMGGPTVFQSDVAAITASYVFNENAAMTAFWARPYNDNYVGNADGDQKNFMDNMDMAGLMVPLTFDGVKVTPWAMYGMQGKNTRFNEGEVETADGALSVTLPGYLPGMNFGPGGLGKTSKAYGSMFWAGLPVAITAFDPLNIEFDINYGYVESMGRYTADRYNGTGFRMGDTKREGWLVKALVEYKMDWGTPGIFGWYASGDDGNVKNGSERLPSIAGAGNFTSFMGDGNYGWGDPRLYDRNLTYAGTWGVGLRIHDMSFVEDLKHSFRVAYWGGTNSPAMAKYVKDAYGWDNGTPEGPYLTTNDGLLEFNLVNSYQIYENLEANLELSYIVNMVDDDTWKRSYRNDSYKKQDAWKAQLIFAYSF